MIIDCISDLHGNYPKLEGGDLLIIAGDLTARDIHIEYLEFFFWLHKQNYKHYIFIAGNHDTLIQKNQVLTSGLANTTYLCDSGTEFTLQYDDIEMEESGMHPTNEKTVRIWGSPWTRTFKGMNPKCKAFTFDTEDELDKKFSLIPDDIDILITHSPPYGIMDECVQGDKIKSVGSTSLEMHIQRVQAKVHVFGHIHEGYGQLVYKRPGYGCENNTIMVNASHVDRWYSPVNKPVRIKL